ncbi:MAG TPA: flagellar export chaperone FliS [Verrucomicrobiae bacterium]|nr:flagellar export chaperone FliS [Verrucomicrobiae bacterium]
MAYSTDAYLETRVFSADGLELVRMLYQAAIGAVAEARQCLVDRDIPARSRAINKTHRILTELTVSLDFERGGEVSRGLARLYDYMSRRLIEANSHQVDAPLAEVLGLLSTLAEGWNGIQPDVLTEAPPSGKGSDGRWEELMTSRPPEPAVHESHAWSF